MDWLTKFFVTDQMNADVVHVQSKGYDVQLLLAVLEQEPSRFDHTITILVELEVIFNLNHHEDISIMKNQKEVRLVESNDFCALLLVDFSHLDY